MFHHLILILVKVSVFAIDSPLYKIYAKELDYTKHVHWESIQLSTDPQIP